MKAVLQLDKMPENCLICTLSTLKNNLRGQSKWVCAAFEGMKVVSVAPESNRPPFCPLKYAEDRCQQADKLPNGKCRGYQRSMWDDEPVERCQECKDFELYGLE